MLLRTCALPVCGPCFFLLLFSSIVWYVSRARLSTLLSWPVALRLPTTESSIVGYPHHFQAVYCFGSLILDICGTSSVRYKSLRSLVTEDSRLLYLGTRNTERFPAQSEAINRSSSAVLDVNLYQNVFLVLQRDHRLDNLHLGNHSFSDE